MRFNAPSHQSAVIAAKTGIQFCAAKRVAVPLDFRLRGNDKWWLVLLAVALYTPAVSANPLRPEQFAEAAAITIEAGRPLQELELPELLYQRVVSPELKDIAVFDAQGTVVPHVICNEPPKLEVVESSRPLTVFPVRLAQAGSAGASAELRTDGGSRIAITVPGRAEKSDAVAVTAYDLNPDAINAPITGLQVRWHSPTGLSEVHLAVEGSAADGRTRLIVADAVLKRVTAEGQTLEQAEIALPPARYQSLRLVPRDAAGTVIERVVARTRDTWQVPGGLRWFTAVSTGPAEAPGENAGSARDFDTIRQAPVRLARVELLEPNTRHAVRLQRRQGLQEAWQTVWSGEAFYLLTPTGERRNEDIELPPSRHRYWRVQADTVAESFMPMPMLHLAYTPERLRFLTQGQGPYRLAYGSTSALSQVRALSCTALLGSLLQAQPGVLDEAEKLIGQSETGTIEVLAGDGALQPPPPDTSSAWRRALLWGVLAVAVLLLLGMARKLFADLKNPS